MSSPDSFTTRFATHATRYLTMFRSAQQLAPAMFRKPALIRHWLLRAHWAQLVLVIFLLSLPSLIPGMIDSVIEQLSPSSTSQKLVRLVDGLLRQHELSTSQTTTRIILWSSATLVVLVLFWLHIPRAAKRAQDLALRREHEADRLRNTDPNQSLLMYQSALSLTLDASLENSLQTKIADIRGTSQQQAGPPPSVPVNSDATVLVAANAAGNTELQPLVAERYRIDGPLGQGAMGLVHRAHDIVLDRDIALKQLAPQLVMDAQFVDRFKQEALALAKLSHPNIVQIYDYIEGTDALGKKQVWIAMELIKGDELAAHLKPKTALPTAKCIQLALQMSQAMAYAHDQGIVHRDFKPANVLVTADGTTKIMDFGLAKIAQSAVRTQAGTVMGSPAFMSPEQAAGKNSDARADIYALGVTLYLMCSGKLPFTGDAQAMLAQHLSQTPPPPQDTNAELSDELNQLILDMLAKSPDDRPQTMGEVADRLRAAAQ